MQTCCLEPFYFQQNYPLKHYKIHTIIQFKPTPVKLNQIPPVPLQHINISNNSHIRRKLAIRNDKYFKNVHASGPDTVQTLKNLKKMKSLHILGKFEFDPYLCEDSGLSPLRKVIDRLRRVKEVSLTIRRVQFKNETDRKFTGLHKIVGLEKLNLNLPSSLNVHDRNYLRIHRAITRCSSVKKYQFKVNSLPNIYPDAGRKAQTFMKNFRKAEEISISIVKVIRAEPDHGLKNSIIELYKLPKVKRFSAEFGISASGWDCAVQNDCALVFLQKILREVINPELLSLKFLATLFNQDFVYAIESAAVAHDNLRELSLDIMSCELEDDVAVLAAQRLSELKHVERLTFKICQRPNVSNISLEAIVKVVECILKAKNIKRFDIYLRNIFLEYKAKELDRRLMEMSGMKYIHLKRSLHVYRD